VNRNVTVPVSGLVIVPPVYRQANVMDDLPAD
jgi:hypothetical protein